MKELGGTSSHAPLTGFGTWPQQVQVGPSQAQFLHEHSKLISFRAVNLTFAFLKIEYGGGAGRQNQKPTCKGV